MTMYSYIQEHYFKNFVKYNRLFDGAIKIRNLDLL